MAVLSGAGISAASGIPTFRGEGGLWKNHRAEELATPEAFDRDPALVWEWYGWRRDLVREAEPNPAHHALAELSARVTRLDIITQNVDGLHERAGLPNGEIVRLHGSLFLLRCTVCGAEREDHEPGPAPGEIPHCRCGGRERPGVVWFGENLAYEDMERAGTIAREAEVFLVVGTSAVVYPAAGFLPVASHSGALVCEFNLETSEAAQGVAITVPGPCEDTLPALLIALGASDG